MPKSPRIIPLVRILLSRRFNDSQLVPNEFQTKALSG